MCLWQDICKRMMYLRHNWYVYDKTYVDVWCLLHKWCVCELCLTDKTRLHMSCHRHINCVLQTSHAYICLVIDTSIVSYRHDTPTYVLSQTHQLCLTDITRLHMSCHRHTNCVLQTLHAYICLDTDISIVSYRHHTPTYFLSVSVTRNM
jgi:predicted metal-dependent HD superfamily phosphohydrolase